jgi:hypothetical protein
MNLKKIFLNHTALLGIAFIEGGIVMAGEIMGGSLLSSAYGTSIYLWAGILGISLLGLASGYFLSAKLMEKISHNKLYLILAGIAVFSSLIPVLNAFLIPLTSGLEIRLSVIIGCFLILFPLMLFCGIVSPYIIQLVGSSDIAAGKISGMVYSISTFGGICFTYICSFILMPSLGIRKSFFLMSFLIIISGIFYFIKNKRNYKS